MPKPALDLSLHSRQERSLTRVVGASAVAFPCVGQGTGTDLLIDGGFDAALGFPESPQPMDGGMDQPGQR